MRVLGISLVDAPGIEPGTSCEASPLTGLSYAACDSTRVQIFKPPLIHLRILEKDIERRSHRSVKSASTVAEAAAQYIEVEEAPQRMGDHSNRGERRRIGFGGRACAEAVHRRDVVGDVVVAEMQNRRLEARDSSVDDHFVMRVDAANMATVAAEESHRPVSINRARVVVAQMVKHALDPIAVDGAR